MPNIIKVPQLPWAPKELSLSLPDNWQIEINNLAGYNRPAMTDDEIKQVVTHPIGIPPIREMAKNKKEVVVIFDDICRVTRVSRIIPFVLEELAKAGIEDGNIRFIAANGLHAAMSRNEFAEKLGEPVMARFPVYNHNPFYNCTYVGTTSRGTKVHINSEYLKCDFKIAIGSITPHAFVTFSGGSKMILPGLAALDTILHNHGLPGDTATRKNYDTNPHHLDMDEAAAFADLDVNIEGLVNLWGDTVELYAGELKQSHATGIKAAKSHYLTKKALNKDVVIANAYAKVSEASCSLGIAFSSIKPEGGDVVLICDTPFGQGHHYALGPCGKLIQSMQSIKAKIPAHVHRLVVFTEYPEIAGLDYYENSPKLKMLTKWEDVIRTLQETYGNKASVAVYPNADIQIF